jgi:hypothetical protein
LQVRLYDTLAGAGLPPAQLREALLLRGSAASSDAPPRLRLMSDDSIAWVSGWWSRGQQLLLAQVQLCYIAAQAAPVQEDCMYHPAIPDISAAPDVMLP